MPYDKYRNWPLPARSGRAVPVMPGPGIEEQVLQDLADAKDEIEKLEILDSFAAYAQRHYRQEFAEGAAIMAGQYLVSLLEPFFLSRLPDVGLRHRGRPTQAFKAKEK